MPNVQQTMKAIRAFGLVVSRTDGEWRINTPKGSEANAYYTTDNDEALAKAEEMYSALCLSKR